jgi:hypothetical protein
LNWGVLNKSVVQSLFALRKEVEQQRKEIGDLRKDVLREQSEKAELKAEKEEKRKEVGKLEGERNKQEGTIAKQASEIEGLKDAKKKCEDELKRSTEANAAQGRELGQLKDDNKAMKAKEDRLVAEVGKLKDDIRRMVSRTWKQFPPSAKKVTITSLVYSDKRKIELGVPNGIVAHLMRECGGNVHDGQAVDVTSGSFEKETFGANPHSGAYENRPDCAAKNAADLDADSVFGSAYRPPSENIPYTMNNWVCYDFKERRIVPTHYTIRTYGNSPGTGHLKSWLVETSADGKSWRQVDRQEDNEQLNGFLFTGTFAVAGGGECRFIRLVNIGRTHHGNDRLNISAWEIFGSLVE